MANLAKDYSIDTCLNTISVRRLAWLTPEWDRFAHLCNASFLGSAGYISAYRLRLIYRVQLFEFFIGDRKIGQCAVAQSRIGKVRKLIFLDCVQLLPDEQPRWSAAMGRLLDVLGSGEYHYGSEWNTAASRAEAAGMLAGVTNLGRHDVEVQAVDFAKWPDWPSYVRAMSTNAKRNAAKAVKADPGIRIEHRRGRQAIRLALQMVAMRRDMHQRKGTEFGLGKTFQFLRALILLRRYVVVDHVVYHGRPSAFAFGFQFGNQYFYIHGACVMDNGGSAWYLLTELLQQTRNISPTGRFLMGCVEQEDQTTGWDNVLRQREQCRVGRFPSSKLKFDYSQLPRAIRVSDWPASDASDGPADRRLNGA